MIKQRPMAKKDTDTTTLIRAVEGMEMAIFLCEEVKKQGDLQLHEMQVQTLILKDILNTLNK